MASSSLHIGIISTQYPLSFWQKIWQPHVCSLCTDTHALQGNFDMVLLADEQRPESLPVFTATVGHLMVASTLYPLTELAWPHQDIVRVSGWPGFWEHNAWELARSAETDSLFWEQTLHTAGIEPLWVPDVTGCIAPATIARLVNEAWWVWQEGISDAASIDLAMQLGTNYPQGPLAWGEQIGLHRIAQLLNKLEAERGDAGPHPALVAKAHPLSL